MNMNDVLESGIQALARTDTRGRNITPLAAR
ncbi:hypothetical protein GGD46_005945 [Rhizobium lusitanum]|uniref:Uncharacterized protein n=1 Tax=Rhizobium lusitanum TaxID=293958 RepID=A0A7X0IWS5_9HYPH|nr:hypothetical protein [Rhizobium lusitanum]